MKASQEYEDVIERNAGGYKKGRDWTREGEGEEASGRRQMGKEKARVNRKRGIKLR